jgi:16S rRNA (adenine1518-N6/adenine1519-N6)-dimethyltransferase
MVVTVQIEVARRIMSRAGEDDYGLLTLLLQLRYQPGPWFRIPAGCFFPEPRVDSACIALTKREQPVFTGRTETYVRLVKAAFSQRRKTMLKLVKNAWPTAPLPDLFREVGIAHVARAETVTVEAFAALAERLELVNAPPAKNG